MMIKKKKGGKHLIFLGVVGAIFIGLCSCANNVEYSSMPMKSGRVRFVKSVKTWEELLKQNVVMQRFDYSCGAASLATLMNYYFQDTVTEGEIIKDILSQLPEEQGKNRQEIGLSLLDLKLYAQRKGYQAVGVKLKFTALKKLKGPILVYLEKDGYRHFTIFRGAVEDRIFLADPSLGNYRLPVYDFLTQWTGASLVLERKVLVYLKNIP